MFKKRFEFIDDLMSLQPDWVLSMAKKVLNDRRKHLVTFVLCDDKLLRF